MKTRLERAAEEIARKHFGDGDSRAYCADSLALIIAGAKWNRAASVEFLEMLMSVYGNQLNVPIIIDKLKKLGDEEEQENIGDSKEIPPPPSKE